MQGARLRPTRRNEWQPLHGLILPRPLEGQGVFSWGRPTPRLESPRADLPSRGNLGEQVIAASLAGGLGNQMFQYAAGRSLALRHDTNLILNLWDLHNSAPHETPRSYALDCFAIRAALRRRVRSRRQLPAAIPAQRRILYRARTLYARFDALQQDFVAFCPEFFSAPDGTLLIGYWQSEAYFAGHEAQIREEFTLQSPPLGRNAELLEEIGAATAVSVHVRRGDYVSNPEVNTRIGVLDEHYFRRAIEAISQRADDVHLIVFSDDQDWCKRHLKGRWPITFAGGSPNAPSEDLRLMSACRHHVIANSSLSWWGAWLNPRPDKMVVAPKQWFRDPELDSSRIVPPGWIQL